MDLTTKCGTCSHFVWEHDLAGDMKGCRFCNCHLGPATKKLPYRHPGMFKPKPDCFKASPLFGSGLGFVDECVGEGRTGIFLLGEAPGEEEERTATPFVGQGGKFLQRLLGRVVDPTTGETFSLDTDVVRGNVIPIRPPFNSLSSLPYPIRAQLLELSYPFWHAQIARSRPKTILALGEFALKATVGSDFKIATVRGCIHNGAFRLGQTVIPIIPTYHPSYILKGNFNLTPAFQVDFRRALFVARHGTPKVTRDYHLYPTITDVENDLAMWRSEGRPLLAYDIETPYIKDDRDFGADWSEEGEKDASYHIDRVSWSWRPLRSFSVPYSGGFRELFLQFLAEAETSCGWNSDAFDNPRIEADGGIINGNHIDLMRLFRFLEPGLPAGLKHTAALFIFDVPAEWCAKVLANQDPALYSTIDSDMTRRLGDILIKKAEEKNVWEVFNRDYVLLGRVLRAMNIQGVNIDVALQKEGFKAFTERFERVLKEIQSLIPQELRPFKEYKSSEERLRNSKSWEEGRMVKVEIEVPEEEAKKAPRREPCATKRAGRGKRKVELTPEILAKLFGD